MPHPISADADPQGGTFRERCRVVVDPAIFFLRYLAGYKNITMSNRCFVFECVYVCVFARGAVAWWGWIELGKEGGEGWR